MLRDEEILQGVLENTQATHHNYTQISNAKALRKLMSKYPDITNAHDDILEALRTHAEAIKKIPSAAFFKLTDEMLANHEITPYDQHFYIDYEDDDVANYTYFDQSISETYQLVCAATLDDMAYAHTEGSDVEKRIHRLLTFLNTVENLTNRKPKPPCNAGKRTELLMSLNFVHPDIKIVEDIRGFLKNLTQEWFAGKLERLSPELQFKMIITHLTSDEEGRVLTGRLLEEIHYFVDLKLKEVGIDPRDPIVKDLKSSYIDAFPYLSVPFLEGHEYKIASLNYLFFISDELKETEEHILLPYQAHVLHAIQETQDCLNLDIVQLKGIPLFVNALKQLNQLISDRNDLVNDKECNFLYREKIETFIKALDYHVTHHAYQYSSENYDELQKTFEDKIAEINAEKEKYKNALATKN